MSLLLPVSSIFLGSFLLFLVQPMAGRMLLPSFGGSPAVWTTALVFYQILLLGGYLYAHLLARLPWPRPAAVAHLLVLALPLLVLPPTPPPGAAPASGSPGEWLALLRALTGLVGLPFLVLATNASVVQHWWAASPRRGERDPYRLYAASNAGSLMALLAYPFVVEPSLDLPAQARLWAGGYLLFALATIGLAWATAARAAGRGDGPALSPPSGDVPGGRRMAAWVLRAAVGSSLLLALTTRITQDLTPVPLLWVAPLALYLVTWIVAFGLPDRLPRSGLAGSTALGIVASLVVPSLPTLLPLGAALAIALWTLGTGALLCHRDLAVDRPHPRHLTAFYLCIAAGGALGGVLVGLVAPLVFDSLAEIPLTLMALALLLHLDPSAPGIRWRPLPPRTGFLAAGVVLLLLAGGREAGTAFWTAGVAGVVGAGLLVRRVPLVLTGGALALGAAFLVSGPVTSLDRERSFFGVVQVRTVEGERRMIHGTTVHGSQSLDPALRRIPGSYYHPSGPMGMAVLDAPPGARIGVVGLGTGALAVLTQPGQTMVFHEIDPAVERLARAHFTFLADAPGEVRVILGDGRITLAGIPEESYDLLIVDAFSSGTIPVHLLTAEAMELYLSRLTPDGLLLLHLSHRYADLRGVVRGFADSAGVAWAMAAHSPMPGAAAQGADPSLVAALSRDPEVIAALPREAGWVRAVPGIRPLLWTDARSDLLRVLR